MYAAEVTVGLGEALVAQGRYREAEAALHRASGAFTGRDSIHWERARALSFHATALSALGRRDEAEAEYQQALALQERNHAAWPAIVPRRNDLVRTLDAYAAFLREGRRPDEARELETRAAVIRASSLTLLAVADTADRP